MIASPARRLRHVHGGIGVAEDPDGSPLIVGSDDRYSDAGLGANGRVAEVHRLGQAAFEFADDDAQVCRPDVAHGEHDELVTTQAPDHVLRRHRGAQALPDALDRKSVV